jgi:adenylosuccinate lyase
LPFIATEDILMAAAAAGGDRQQLHERIREHSQSAGQGVKQHGRANDLLERLKADPAFAQVKWPGLLNPRRYVGLAPQQTREYLKKVVAPAFKALDLGHVPTATLHV